MIEGGPRRRKWVYVHHPKAYEITCNLCGNPHVEWSEYRGMIFCWRCLKDVPGNPGVFDGPFPMNREFHELLGISIDRIHIPSGRIMRWEFSKNGNRVIWKLERKVQG